MLPLGYFWYGCTLTNEYKFRFAYTPGWTGVRNMGVDYYLGEVSPPDLPLIRLYTWDRPTISLGCNQNPVKRIDLASCKRDNIPVVQRPTGGRELLHGHDICYCAAWPHKERLDAVTARDVFAAITESLVRGLAKMGVSGQWKSIGGRSRINHGPCFAQTDAGEITVNEKKLIASAQRVFNNCIIQEGSIPLAQANIDLTSYLLAENREQVRTALDSNTSYLSEYLPMGFPTNSIVLSFKEAFEDSFGGSAGPADRLLEKYEGNIQEKLWYY